MAAIRVVSFRPVDAAWPITDVYAPLAGWMHRVCADLAGCYANSGMCRVRLRWFVA